MATLNPIGGVVDSLGLQDIQRNRANRKDALDVDVWKGVERFPIRGNPDTLYAEIGMIQ